MAPTQNPTPPLVGRPSKHQINLEHNLSKLDDLMQSLAVSDFQNRDQHEPPSPASFVGHGSNPQLSHTRSRSLASGGSLGVHEETFGQVMAGNTIIHSFLEILSSTSDYKQVWKNRYMVLTANSSSSGPMIHVFRNNVDLNAAPVLGIPVESVSAPVYDSGVQSYLVSVQAVAGGHHQHHRTFTFKSVSVDALYAWYDGIVKALEGSNGSVRQSVSSGSSVQPPSPRPRMDSASTSVGPVPLSRSGSYAGRSVAPRPPNEERQAELRRLHEDYLKELGGRRIRIREFLARKEFEERKRREHFELMGRVVGSVANEVEAREKREEEERQAERIKRSLGLSFGVQL
ncbi:hypothetical protein BCR33DRAFT_723198 [Rhizoclosmatium globosum]|uniref:PH domain-containing protein n=1 Tax=Rhizoclosmatium globosum TaxID=329046 RepID=A0A1Y2BF73_9FUNG|nr:hypothetical protein BCR33DRAFT_723198 [Rhizoclosmatium globosum]|eukprot:ORY33190.1 hypothetical protein BCR33DRAFT_723198 [Rhizoclosmatium globosum]